MKKGKKKMTTTTYRPLLVTYFDLLGETFIAPGVAQNEYTIMKVTPSRCEVMRHKDGERIWLDTGRVLQIVNGKY